MPYSMDNIPEQIKDLPKDAQEIWISAYNAANESGYDEESCHRIAWAAVKRKYEKGDDGEWHRKTEASLGVIRGNLTFADPEQSLVKTIQVIRSGEFEDMHGTLVSISPDDLDILASNSNAALREREIPVELGHPSDPGAPAVAWYRRFFKRIIDGVEWVCAEIELTSQGLQVLKDRLYKYFSAELNLDTMTIVGGGFVNRPAVGGQRVIGSLAKGTQEKGTQEKGETFMDDLEKQLAAAREEARLAVESQMRELQAQLARAREEERAKVMAEFQRQNEIAQFARAVTNGKRALPFSEAEMVKFLTGLPDDVGIAVQDVLRKIVEKGLVDLSEIGSSLNVPTKKQLDHAVRLALTRYLNGGGTLASFCRANDLNPDDFDLSEFEKK
jgi:cation transport regulator